MNKNQITWNTIVAGAVNQHLEVLPKIEHQTVGFGRFFFAVTNA
jgi:hypothetical protein